MKTLSWAMYIPGKQASSTANVDLPSFPSSDSPSSDKNDADKPISCGFYRLEAGKPLVYTYTYHEMKIIVEGEFDISDESGQEVHAVAGDVFYFPKGSVITFKTKTYGLAFYTGQRAEGGA
jgi:uncharacterized cupin superfamily protein